MKKFMTLALTTVMALVATSVFATTAYTAKIELSKNTVKAGEELEVVLKLGDFTANEKGINVIMGTLEYDRTIFETVQQEDITAVQNWENPMYNPGTGQFITDSYKFISEDHNAIKVKFKVKTSIDKSQTTEIKFKELEASDAESDIKTEDAIMRVQVEKSADANSTSGIDNKVIYVAIAVLAVVVVGSVVIVFIKRKK